MTRTFLMLAAGACALSLAACGDSREQAAADNGARLAGAAAEAAKPAPVPGSGTTVTTVRTGTMSSGTQGSDIVFNAPPPGRPKGNAHGGS